MNIIIEHGIVYADEVIQAVKLFEDKPHSLLMPGSQAYSKEPGYNF